MAGNIHSREGVGCQDAADIEAAVRHGLREGGVLLPVGDEVSGSSQAGAHEQDSSRPDVQRQDRHRERTWSVLGWW